MSSRPITPSNDVYGATPRTGSRPSSVHSGRNSYNATSTVGGVFASEQGQDPRRDNSPLAQSLGRQDDRNSFTGRDDAMTQDAHSMTGSNLRRSSSQMSQSQVLMPSKGGTLKKKASLRKSGSLKRSSSKRNSRAGSVRSLALGEKEKYGEGEEFNSAFLTPIPTTGSPTDVLANRFQAWRKVLKDLITYFRDVQKSHDVRSKTLLTASNVINNTTIPAEFRSTNGMCDATYILRNFHSQALSESNKAREIENEVVMQLTGLRSDLQQKIKEIKSLSGDFKNSVEKEIEGSRKAVRQLQEALGLVDSDPAAVAGKGDPFIVKLGVDRQIERQIEEENYLHRAYLNLESSGRELESIVVGEIQKAYSAYAGVLKREADQAFETAEKLREGPLTLSKDVEWDYFVTKNDHMVNPSIPVRSWEHINYPGKSHAAATEVRSGMLERKSKYLKNYTPGWYILSPTHLHEFKSADGIASQAPVMSLYLPEQKLSSHSERGSSSHKFMVKGRQTGGMHRGHAWVFRAESYDTMMAWYTDIQQLAEKSGKERDAFVRRTHARSLSGGSVKAQSIGSSDGGLEEDEADAQPYSSEQSIRGGSVAGMVGIHDGGGGDGPGGQRRYRYGEQPLDEAGWQSPQRPSPGGRFPSNLKVDRGLRARHSPSSGDSSAEGDRDTIAAAGALPGSGIPFASTQATNERDENMGNVEEEAQGASQAQHLPPASQPGYQNQKIGQPHQDSQLYQGEGDPSQYRADLNPPMAPQDYGAPATATAAAAGGLAAVSGAAHQHEQPAIAEMDQAAAISAPGTSNINNTNDAGRALSSHGDTGSLSTMPTSVGSVQNNNTPSRSEATTTDPVTGSSNTAATKPIPLRSTTAGTISDLHIPGEYPKTPKTPKTPNQLAK